MATILFLTGCNQAPQDPGPPEISEEERATGAEQHQQLLASMGGEYRGDAKNYVQSVGASVADAAGLGGQCHFTLVNSDVVNAFAVPGCYIYVTRGLMAVVTSEAELASVLGHEVGHIVAQHSARQQERSLWSMLGVLAVSLTGSERLTRIAGQAVSLFGLRYSREQEYQADDLGIRYVSTAGYDPFAAADMLGALGRQERFVKETGGQDAARSLPEWASSHPLPANRVERAIQAAEDTGIAEDARGEKEAVYLAKIDGLLFGDDPKQGFVIGRRFAHPIMRIGFEAPPGFTLANSPEAIGITGPGDIRGEFGGGQLRGGDLDAYMRGLIGELVDGAPTQADLARSPINGLPARIAQLRVEGPDGGAHLLVAAYDGGGGRAFHFVIATPPRQGRAAIDQLFASFHLLGPGEVAALRPRMIKVVTAGALASADSLSRQMADRNGRALFTALNGDATVKAGTQYKLVRYRNPGTN
ncbi:M48 family metalloprotease [Sphingomonas montanisoli]|uniref:M48 family metalloprotease n=1 Tax=Sphingomonas montanisoli TaxID=2606412 RepID=UPI0015E17743|nr:M48 family metalloprotease [Sphingomonas montanisoli]